MRSTDYNLDAGCCDPCTPELLDYKRPIEPINCDPAPAVCSHALLDKLATFHPHKICDGPSRYAACVALHYAESLTGGIYKARLREQALMYTALHLLELNLIDQVNSAARLAAIAAGEGASINTSGNFWELTHWGVAAKAMRDHNPTLGFVGIG
jgi:hypothetical protein